jgi:hypothetical protein
MATKVAAKKAVEEKRNPEFTLRAKSVNPHNGKETWLNIGAMWPTSWPERDENGKETGDTVHGFSVKINSAPTNWNGDCLAMPFKEFQRR